MNVLRSLIEALEANQTAIVATIVGPNDLPAEMLGRRLVARANGSVFGSLGSPTLDAFVVTNGQALAGETTPAKLLKWSPGPDDELAQGLSPVKELEVLVEAIMPPPTLLIVGAGHIAQPLARMGKMVGFRVTVLDDRPEFANRGRFPEVDDIIVGGYAEELARFRLTPRTYVVLVTRGHVQDEEALRQIITADVPYLGMIGSRRRVSEVLKRIVESGVPQAAADRTYSPIGLDIGAETPEEIAVSIIAEVINVRRRGEPHPSSMSQRRRAAAEQSAR